MKRKLLKIIVGIICISLVLSFSLIGCKEKAVEEAAEAVEEAAEEVEEAEAEGTELDITEAADKAKSIAEEVLSTNKAFNIEGSPKVAVVMPALYNEGWLALYIGTLRKLMEEGAGIETYSANDDVDLQIQIIEDMIAKKVDGIIFAPLDAGALSKPVIEANEAGIPIVALDSRTSDGEVSVIETDNYMCGVKAGEMMAKAANGKEIKAFNLQGDMAYTSGIERSAGFEDEVAKYENIEIVARSAANWLADDGNAAILDSFQAHPEINGIYFATDGYTEAGIAALKQLGRLYEVGDPNHVIICSNDGFPIGLEAIRNGYVDANSSQPLFNGGSRGAEVLLDMINDPEMPVIVEKLPPIVITIDNVDDPNLWGNQF